MEGILKILHDPKYLIPWEFRYHSILGLCRIFSIKSRNYRAPLADLARGVLRSFQLSVRRGGLYRDI